MADKTLRALAKDYAEGLINKDSYRKARDELLKGILTGKILVKKNEYRAPLEVEDVDVTRDKTAIMAESRSPKAPRPATTEAVTPVTPPPSPSPAIPHQKLLLVTSVIAVVCAIIIIVLIAMPESENQTQGTIIDMTEQQEISTTQNNTAGKKLIEEFIRQNNWSDNNIRLFLSEWNSLSAAEQTDALSSSTRVQLANAINRQLLEERALFNLGGDRASVITRQRTLVDFASALSIEDPNIFVQEFDESQITKNQTATAQPDDDNTHDVESSAIPPDSTSTVEGVNTIAISTDDATDPTVTTVAAANQTTEITEELTVPEAVDITETTDTTDAPPPAIKPLPVQETKTTANTGQAANETTATPVNKNACHAALAKQRQPYCRDILDGIGKGPTLVVLPRGKFMMGGEKPHELPVHEVVIAKPFAIAVNEITNGEFEQFCIDTQKNCSRQPWADKEYPVVNITWNDAFAYTEWLSEKTGNRYRLPTEAEWEYAARARTTTRYPFGDEILITDAVFSSIKTLTSPLPRSDRSINRNKFRLYHMVGNVREWVRDTWSDSYNNAPADGTAYINPTTSERVVRGGSYADNDDALRSGARISLPADHADVYTGFRIVQELSE